MTKGGVAESPGNRREAYHQHGQVCEGPGEEIPVTAKIHLSDNISPSAFGDPPDPHTVDGRRRSAIQAAEKRRLNRIRKDQEEAEQDRNWLAGAD